MNPEEPELEQSVPPIVFISYSHDSREHKQWVTRLATALRSNHIEVILDQWDLEPGDDIPKFMERSVKAADRVLMICTDPYVRKANDSKGGTGYEAMIVSGELVRDLGTRKFIPIIRQGEGEPLRPDCVVTRLHIDFSRDDDFDSQLGELVKTIHQASRMKKPPLGPNPFLGLSNPSFESQARQKSSEKSFEEAILDPRVAYELAISLVQSDDHITWKRLLKTLQKRALSDLFAFRATNETVPQCTKNDLSPLYEHAAQGVGFYMPLFACLVAGAESGKAEFNAQLGWIDEIYDPPKWNRAGTLYWGDFPQLALFIGQALIGGMLMETRASKEVYELATTRISDNYGESKSLFGQTRIVGWPNSLNHDCSVAWGFLNKLLEEQKWISIAYGSADDARSAISSYYQLLSFLNFCDLTVKGRFDSGELEWAVSVPLNFCGWPKKNTRKGYQTLLTHRAMITDVLQGNDLRDGEKFQKYWKQWLEVCSKWLVSVFRWNHFGLEMPQQTLPNDLKSKGFSLK